MVVYNNFSGMALIDPLRHVISPVLLDAYDPTIDPETGDPVGGPLGTQNGDRFFAEDIAIDPSGTWTLVTGGRGGACNSQRFAVH